MKCPHCLEAFFEDWSNEFIGEDAGGSLQVRHALCPSCKKRTVQLGVYDDVKGKYSYTLVRPKGITRMPIPQEIPAVFAEDYKEACLTISDSPKASAAISRRCLQNLLREKESTTSRDLVDQIQEALDKRSLPSHLAEGLDAIRVIGNFAVHPTKSRSSGEIVEVEPGEAEWNLDVLEGLFDFYFVQPEILKKKRDILNQKLQDVGKPPLR